MEQIVIEQLNDQVIELYLEELYRLKDSNSKYQYLVVSPALHKALTAYLFKDNKYRVRIEEIAGMRYSVSQQWKDVDVPKAYLCAIDLQKIVAVYTDYEGNAINIEDLFDSKYNEWQKN